MGYYIVYDIVSTNDTYYTASPRSQQISWPPAWLDYYNGINQGDPPIAPTPTPIAAPQDANTVAEPVPFGGLGVVGFALIITGVFIVLLVLVFVFVLLLRNKVRQENERARAQAEARRRRRARRREPTHQIEVTKKKTSSGKKKVVTETMNVGDLDDREVDAAYNAYESEEEEPETPHEDLD